MFNRKRVLEQEEKVSLMSRRLNDLLRERMLSPSQGPEDKGYILFYMDLLKNEETKLFRLQLKYGLWGWLTW